MVELTIFTLGLIGGAFCTYFIIRKRSSEACQHGVAQYAEKQQSEKQTRKERILEILEEQGSVTNDDIEKSLGVSDTTATNYLQELEREGRIEQVGERGRFVSYQLK